MEWTHLRNSANSINEKTKVYVFKIYSARYCDFCFEYLITRVQGPGSLYIINPTNFLLPQYAYIVLKFVYKQVFLFF